MPTEVNTERIDKAIDDLRNGIGVDLDVIEYNKWPVEDRLIFTEKEIELTDEKIEQMQQTKANLQMMYMILEQEKRLLDLVDEFDLNVD